MRQKHLGLPAETYIRLKQLAQEQDRTMVAVVERFIAAAERLR